MKGINKVILIGNLGQDPEIRYTSGGMAIATLSLATSESWRDKQTGEQKERTEWHRCVLYRRLAEIAGEYLKKGAKVYLEGKLQTREWQDQQGQKRYTTEIVANEMQMLDSRNAGTGGNMAAPAQQPQQGNWGRPSAPAAAPQGGANPGYGQPAAPQGGYAPAPAAQQPTYNEPPMDFDDDIPF